MIKGVCHFFSETGTEGGHWAFHDESKSGPDGKWLYEGLHILEDGDHLTIFSKENPAEELWSGVISLIRYDVFREHARGFWIHADQIGIPREQWALWFLNEHPGTLRKKV